MRKPDRARTWTVVAILLAGSLPGASRAAAQAGDMPPVDVTTLTDTLPGAVGGVTVDRSGNIYVVFRPGRFIND